MQNTVKFVNQPYDKPGDLQNLLHYAMTDKRTGTWCEYTGGINTAPLYAIDEMMYVNKHRAACHPDNPLGLHRQHESRAERLPAGV